MLIADAHVESDEERALPMPVRKVFLSSTGADLRIYREAAYAVLHKMDDYHCVRMEDFGARDWDVDVTGHGVFLRRSHGSSR